MKRPGEQLSDRLTRPSWAVPALAPDPTQGPWMVPWIRMGCASVARIVLTMAMSLALWAGAPALLGWHATTVVTGSMEPKIHPGDVVSARAVSIGRVRPGMVLLVDDPDHRDRLRLHRLVRFSGDGSLVLRGDANPQEDSSHVNPRAVRGVASLRVPYVAIPILWIHEQAWIKLAALVAVVLALVALMGLDREARPGQSSTEPDSG